MSRELYQLVLERLRKQLPFGIRSHLTLSADVPLLPQATFFDYVVISQRRYWASSRARNPTNSLVAISRGPGKYDVGKLVSIFALVQPRPSIEATTHVLRLGQVRMLRRVEGAFAPESAWAAT
jgi:hypothetical protein